MTDVVPLLHFQASQADAALQHMLAEEPRLSRQAVPTDFLVNFGRHLVLLSVHMGVPNVPKGFCLGCILAGISRVEFLYGHPALPNVTRNT